VADYAPKVKQALRAAGWRYERPGKGDHEVWVNPATGNRMEENAPGVIRTPDLLVRSPNWGLLAELC
jgi:hypothetical protein